MRGDSYDPPRLGVGARTHSEKCWQTFGIVWIERVLTADSNLRAENRPLGDVF